MTVTRHDRALAYIQGNLDQFFQQFFLQHSQQYRRQFLAATGHVDTAGLDADAIRQKKHDHVAKQHDLFRITPMRAETHGLPIDFPGFKDAYLEQVYTAHQSVKLGLSEGGLGLLISTISNWLDDKRDRLLPDLLNNSGQFKDPILNRLDAARDLDKRMMHYPEQRAYQKGRTFIQPRRRKPDGPDEGPSR